MPRNNLVTVLLSTFFAMAALYGPQPLLPFFARLFVVSEAEAASLISWSLFSMSIGPLFMGYLLQRFTPEHMFRWCLIGLAGATLAFAFTAGIGWMKALRFLQGGIIAAQLAATMTYITGASTDMRQVMAYYVGAAVMGGLCGRVVAGFVSEYVDWRYFFGILAFALLLCARRSYGLAASRHVTHVSFAPGRYRRIVQDGYVRRLYLIILLAFFVMTAILNFVPFRLEELNSAMGESLISLFYLGYVVGFLVSINAPRIADFVGGTFRAAWVGIGIVFVGLIAGSLPSAGAIFAAVTMVTSGFFLQHTSIATLLNRYAGEQVGSVNSLYISIYYLGGTAGSYMPGLLYVSVGWMYFIGLLFLFVLTSVGVVLATRVPENAVFT